MKDNLIIFDLDGVLVNSKNNMKNSLNFTAKKLKIKLNFKNYLKFLGLPFEQIIIKIGVKKNIALIKKIYEEASIRKIGNIKIKKKDLKDLKKLKKNSHLAVFTSKSKKRTKLILKRYSLFDYIISADDVNHGKPNPEGVLKILEKFKIEKKNTFYIGDSTFDYLAAKRAKVNYLHARWGYEKKISNKKNVLSINNFYQINKYLK